MAQAVLAALPPPYTVKLDDLIFSSGSGKWSTVATKSIVARPTHRMCGLFLGTIVMAAANKLSANNTRRENLVVLIHMQGYVEKAEENAIQ